MSNSALKFFGFRFFPGIALIALFLSVVGVIEVGTFVGLILFIWIPWTITLLFARSITQQERSMNLDDKSLHDYMNNLGYSQVDPSKFEVKMTGIYGKEYESIRYQDHTLTVFPFRTPAGVSSDRFVFNYAGNGMNKIFVIDTLNEVGLLFEK